jgi:hypothetical protein
MKKKTVSGNHEELIIFARKLLQNMSEIDSMHYLINSGIKPEDSYLLVKAAKILREPYEYVEKKDRMIHYEDNEK